MFDVRKWNWDNLHMMWLAYSAGQATQTAKSFKASKQD